MMKPSFVVILVSFSFICMVKKNTAVLSNTNSQPESSANVKPDIVIPIKNLQELSSSIRSNTGNTAFENETKGQPESSDTKPHIAIPITYLPGSGPSTHSNTAENKPKDQPQNSDIVIQIDHSNESGASHSDTESNFEPFEVVISERYARTPALISYKLPSDFIEVNKKWTLASGSEYTLVTPLCPEYEPTSYIKASAFLDSVIATFPDMAKCLFVKHFKKDETQMRCLKEPELVVKGIKDGAGLPVICGIQQHQRLVEAQYYNCGSEQNVISYANDVRFHTETNGGLMKDLPYEIQRYTMYQICYDFESHQTLWTKHSPSTPALIANEESPYKELSNEFKIEDFDDDASLLALTDSTFSSLKNSYLRTDSDETQVYTMVPKDHMALYYWKKATTHMINSAPLSPKFIPLIKAINNGILQATIKSKRTLEIYTKAETIVKILTNLATSIHPYVKSAMSLIFPGKPINLFQPNIWYYFVYDKGEKSGILIVLHNTQKILPEDLACNQTKRITCEFKTWSDSSFDDTLLDYAYCCPMSQNQVQQLFSIREIDHGKILDIQEIIKPTKTVTLATEMILRDV